MERSQHRPRIRFCDEPAVRDPEVDGDVVAAVDPFNHYAATLPAHLRELARMAPAWRRRGNGLGQYLPFWLDRALSGGGWRAAAGQMALANRFGQGFCLLQDEIIDEAEDTSTAILLPADLLFFRFLHGYQALFAADHPFWGHFERYWREYLEALAWEKRCCRRPHRYEPGDFAALGRKFSPVKICCAGICLLAGRTDVLPRLEELVETLHIGCQLLDDLRDWPEDFARGHWTWPLVLACEHSAEAPTIDDVERSLWHEGGAAIVVGMGIEHLDRAEHQSRELALDALARWIGEFRRAADARIRSASSSEAVAAGPPLKVIVNGDASIVFNISTGGVFVVAPEISAVLEQLAAGDEEPIGSGHSEAVEELARAGVLGVLPPPVRQASPPIATVFLDAGTGQAHRCFGCQGGEGGRPCLQGGGARALDRLFSMDTVAKIVDVVFLCGPGGAASAFVAEIIGRSRRGTEAAERTLRFHLVADAAAPDLDAIAEVAKVGGHVHLSKDRLRDSFDLENALAAAGAVRERGAKRLSINLGLDNYREPLADVIERLDRGGFDPIGLQSLRIAEGVLDAAAMERDFTILVQHFTAALQAGRLIPLVDVLYPLGLVYRRKRRAAHCDAGAGMLTATRDGSLFPCFRFSGDPDLRAGGIAERLELERWAAYRRSAVDEREPCRSCWARYLCGGGCYDNHRHATGDALLPSAVQCALIKHRFEEILRLSVGIEPYLVDLDAHLHREEFVTFIADS